MQNNCSIQLAAFSFYPLLFIKKKQESRFVFPLFSPLAFSVFD